MKKRTRKQLELIVISARSELDDLDWKETAKINADLLGKCYKFKDCYSCPEKESDYWYVYKQYLRLEGREILALCFYVDKYDKISLSLMREHGDLSGWTEIGLQEFWDEWLNLKTKISKFQGMIR